jgi:prevent-host-death family protein
MERVVSATEARIRFGELMRQAVENHETIVVQRGGESHVVVMSIEEYERLLQRQRQSDWIELVHGARAQIQVELGNRSLPRPEEILDQTRKGRDERLLGLR